MNITKYCIILEGMQSQLAAHWDDLSLPEQEQICIGIDEGLTEEQLRFLMLRSLEDMQKLRVMFIKENKSLKD